MAVVTLTTDTFLDSATRVAGDTYNVNGCTFTIRTDTRVHAGAPASMTGSLNNITVSTSLGGAIKIDGTKVRWLKYNAAGGSTPTPGSTATSGGVSGVFLGAWTTINGAPITTGTSFTSTGYVKFREITGGPFTVGSTITFDNGATVVAQATDGATTGADAPGWLEIVRDTATTFSVYELGDGLVIQGDWFYLGTTSGSRGDIFNTPANGNTDTYVNAVQIETSAGSDVYEWYPACHATLGGANWNTTNLTTDLRAKFVETISSGQIRIGHNAATTAIGYLPPAGCKVRMPNIIGQTVAVASRAVNTTPGVLTRATATGGKYTINLFHGPWFFNCGTNRKLNVIEAAMDSSMAITFNETPVTITKSCFGGFIYSTAAPALTLTNIKGSTITDIKVVNGGYILGTLRLEYSSDITVTNLESIAAKVKTSGPCQIYCQALSNSTFLNSKIKGGNVIFTTCNNIDITNTDFVDRVEGATTSVNAVSVFNLSQSTFINIDGLTFGEGVLTNVHQYSPFIQTGSNPNSNIKIRNFGTRQAPLNCGSSATLYPTSIYTGSNGDNNYKIQRIFVTGLRSTIGQGLNAAYESLFLEDIFVGSYNSFTGFTLNGNSSVYRKIYTPSITNTAPVPCSGTHWVDYFTSDTAGQIRWMAEPPAANSAAKNYIEVTPSLGTGYIGAVGTISLDTAGDTVYSESDWMFLGHTGFQNVIPTYGTSTTPISTLASIQAGSFEVDMYYTILSIGTTNFTLYGAASNTVGLTFKATAAGAGTGRATSLILNRFYTILTVGTSNFTLMGATSNTVGEVFEATTLTVASTTGSGTLITIPISYQLDTGSGFSGTWKFASPSNLSAETLPASGFKLKIKFTQGRSSAASAISNISFLTTSTASAQADNVYPLDTNTLGFTGLITGSEVRVYQGSDPATATEIGGTESTGGSTFSFTHSSGGSAGVIAIFALGYMPIYLPYTFKSIDETILIQPVVDRNYTNPV